MIESELEELRKFKAEYTRHAKFPPGHFYSPISSVDELKQREDEIWSPPQASIPGIDLAADSQLRLLKKFHKYYPQIPFSEEKQEGFRYNYINNFYSYTDAIFLYSMIHHFRPRRIIEVGSGFSSAVMLDTRQHLQRDIELTFIEPYPKRLMNLITEQDKHTVTILAKPLQKIDKQIFQTLEANDILFIDSTHVSKTGSDVNMLLFEILPMLKPGVFIHFHDVFHPFVYPKNWEFAGRNWNETYILRAFLMHNQQYRIVLFASYLHQMHSEAFTEMPLCNKNNGGNIWLQKLPGSGLKRFYFRRLMKK